MRVNIFALHSLAEMPLHLIVKEVDCYKDNNVKPFFRDASFGTCLYNLNILDCLRAVHKVGHFLGH